MAALVPTREYVLNGTLVHMSLTQTRSESKELKQLTHHISQALTAPAIIFEVQVCNDAITVVPAPGVVNEQGIDHAVVRAMSEHRIHGAALYDADPTIKSPFKVVRPGTMKLEAQKEADWYWSVLMMMYRLVSRSYADKPKSKRRRLIARNARTAAEMILRVACSRTGR